MKPTAWTCGLVAALVGCGAVDRAYEPPVRGPLLGDRTLLAPPASPASWKPMPRPEALAYRTPSPYSNQTLAEQAGQPPATARSADRPAPPAEEDRRADRSLLAT